MSREPLGRGSRRCRVTPRDDQLASCFSRYLDRSAAGEKLGCDAYAAFNRLMMSYLANSFKRDTLMAVNQTLGEGAGRCAVPRGDPKPDGLGAVPRAHGAIRTRVEPTCYLVGLSGKAGGSR